MKNPKRKRVDWRRFKIPGPMYEFNRPAKYPVERPRAKRKLPDRDYWTDEDLGMDLALTPGECRTLRRWGELLPVTDCYPWRYDRAQVEHIKALFYHGPDLKLEVSDGEVSGRVEGGDCEAGRRGSTKRGGGGKVRVGE